MSRNSKIACVVPSRMSKDCVPFGEALERRSAKVDEGFVRVLCTSISWPYSGDVVYRAFHSFPIKPRSKRIIKGSKGKGHRWMKKGSKKVPSVVLLGIDSVSRLSFHRTMSRTKKALQDLGAVELQGYTKGRLLSTIEIELCLKSNT